MKQRNYVKFIPLSDLQLNRIESSLSVWVLITRRLRTTSGFVSYVQPVFDLRRLDRKPT